MQAQDDLNFMERELSNNALRLSLRADEVVLPSSSIGAGAAAGTASTTAAGSHLEFEAEPAAGTAEAAAQGFAANH